MPLLALTDHIPLQCLQSGEQGGDAVALVVVGHRPTTPLFNGQDGLGPVQRLDLALLVPRTTRSLLAADSSKARSRRSFSLGTWGRAIV